MTVLNDQALRPAERADAAGVPPLSPGQRLKADEFRRRYEAMGPGVRAELIGGIVHLYTRDDGMPSPVNNRKHGKPHLTVAGLVHDYQARTPGLEYGCDSTIRLDDDREPQPDVFLALPRHLGGGAHEDANGWIVGAPELVVEVSAATARRDLGEKLDDYREVGVAEYVVWLTVQKKVCWFDLAPGGYDERAPDADGLFRSLTFPGLWLDPAAMLRLDSARMLDALDRGRRTPEHADFVRRLAGP